MSEATFKRVLKALTGSRVQRVRKGYYRLIKVH
jgi:hypothetical protein